MNKMVFSGLPMGLLSILILLTMTFSCTQPLPDSDGNGDSGNNGGGTETVKYNLSVKKLSGNTGTGAVNSSISTLEGTFAENTEITVEAVADSNSRFTGWYDANDGGQLVSSNVKYVFMLTANTSLYAGFEKVQFAFSTAIATDSKGGGVINGATTTADGSYALDSTITVEAGAPEAGSFFFGWYDAPTGGDIISRDVKYTFSIDKDIALYARFDIDNIIFPDPVLDAIIRSKLGKTTLEDVITYADLQVIYMLEHERPGDGKISDLTGIEYLTAMGNLNLIGNNISDISQIGNLTNLIDVALGSNKISDISPLVRSKKNIDLYTFTKIFLADNLISDISSFQELPSFQYLWLENNLITDITPLINNSRMHSIPNRPLNVLLTGNVIPTEQVTQLRGKGVNVTVTGP